MRYQGTRMLIIGWGMRVGQMGLTIPQVEIEGLEFVSDDRPFIGRFGQSCV